MNISEILIGITEIAVALAGFTGIVVAFGSRREGSWHPGDRLRLGFLLEASLTGAALALVGLVLVSTHLDEAMCWSICSAVWTICMIISLAASRGTLRKNQDIHGDVDRFANKVTAAMFICMIALQIVNIVLWQQFWPFLAGLTLNLAGAAMQFARLIRSAFHT